MALRAWKDGDRCPFCGTPHGGGLACETWAELVESPHVGPWWAILNRWPALSAEVSPDDQYQGTRVYVKEFRPIDFSRAAQPMTDFETYRQDWSVTVSDFAAIQTRPEALGPYRGRRAVLHLAARYLQARYGAPVLGVAAYLRALLLSPHPEIDRLTHGARGIHRQLCGDMPGPLQPEALDTAERYRSPFSDRLGRDFAKDVVEQEREAEAGRRKVIRAEVEADALQAHLAEIQASRAAGTPPPEILKALANAQPIPVSPESSTNTVTGRRAAAARGLDRERRLGR